MPRRAYPARAVDIVPVARVARPAAESYSSVDPRTLTEEPAFGLAAQNVLGGVASNLRYMDEGENLGTEIGTRDGASWAIVHHTRDERGHRVLQAGPRRLWDEVEAVRRIWMRHGRPAVDRFGLTVCGGAAPVLWLDEPANALSAAHSAEKS